MVVPTGKKDTGIWNWVCAVLAYGLLGIYSLAFQNLFTERQATGGYVVSLYFFSGLLIGSAAWDVAKSLVRDINNEAARKLLRETGAGVYFFLLYIAMMVIARYEYIYRESGGIWVACILLVLSPFLAVSGLYFIARAILKVSGAIDFALKEMEG